jgi:hypothetical protein
MYTIQQTWSAMFLKSLSLKDCANVLVHATMYIKLYAMNRVNTTKVTVMAAYKNMWTMTNWTCEQARPYNNMSSYWCHSLEAIIVIRSKANHWWVPIMMGCMAGGETYFGRGMGAPTSSQVEVFVIIWKRNTYDLLLFKSSIISFSASSRCSFSALSAASNRASLLTICYENKETSIVTRCNLNNSMYWCLAMKTGEEVGQLLNLTTLLIYFFLISMFMEPSWAAK